MKVQNISKRTFRHQNFHLEPGATLVVPDFVGRGWLKTKEVIEVKEIEQYVVEHTYEIGELPSKPDISKAKLTTKKVSKNAKRNNKRI